MMKKISFLIHIKWVPTPSLRMTSEKNYFQSHCTKNFLTLILLLSAAGNIHASMSEYGKQVGSWLVLHPLSTAIGISAGMLAHEYALTRYEGAQEHVYNPQDKLLVDYEGPSGDPLTNQARSSIESIFRECGVKERITVKLANRWSNETLLPAVICIKNKLGNYDVQFMNQEANCLLRGTMNEVEGCTLPQLLSNLYGVAAAIKRGDAEYNECGFDPTLACKRWATKDHLSALLFAGAAFSAVLGMWQAGISDNWISSSQKMIGQIVQSAALGLATTWVAEKGFYAIKDAAQRAQLAKQDMLILQKARDLEIQTPGKGQEVLQNLFGYLQLRKERQWEPYEYSRGTIKFGARNYKDPLYEHRAARVGAALTELRKANKN